MNVATPQAAPLVRERIVRWEDPEALAAAGRRMSGLEFFEAMRDGRLPPPPVCELIGFTVTEVGDGHVVMSTMPHEAQYTPIGTVHGGIIATLLDSVMGCAVHTKLPVGRG